MTLKSVVKDNLTNPWCTDENHGVLMKIQYYNITAIFEPVCSAWLCFFLVSECREKWTLEPVEMAILLQWVKFVDWKKDDLEAYQCECIFRIT